MGAELSRRAVLRGGCAVGLATLIPAEILAACASSPSSAFDGHEMEVVTEATARLIPGPRDDPAEAGHPGAREAGAAAYIAVMLGALDVSPPKVFAGGPFSNRAGSHVDDMADFLIISRKTTTAWRQRLATIRSCYHSGIAALDAAARHAHPGGFLSIGPARQDQVLALNPKVPGLPSDFTGFTDMLFAHTIEGTYSAPEYGGNRGLVGWSDIGFRGDVQPRGYTDSEVVRPPSRSTLQPTGAVQKVIDVLSATAPPPLTGP